MHLKKVFIKGFKSFADKTEIEFKERITAIVGPNGSGKSNVADAIRWVLGEQSIKNLRGNKMEDFIFSGTDNRKALGYAEVTIILDNSNGFLPVDYQEVAITRRMFRSGESEYYINKNLCRLKDIRELLMDTGIGKDGYSIIGQGRIDEILSTRPEDRRNIFEEAAGIVKYKTRKIEAEKKLEKTNNNIQRIEDIIRELNIQYESLREKSNKAKEYLELYSKIREIEINLIIREIERLREQIDIYCKEKEKIENEIYENGEKKKKIEDKLSFLKEELESKNLMIDQIQKEKENIIDDMNNRQNQLMLLEEKKKFYEKDVQRLTKELEELDLKFVNLKEEKEKILDTVAIRRKELGSLKDKYIYKNKKLMELNNYIGEGEKEIEAEKNKVMDLYNEIADKKSKLNSINIFKENITKRIKQIEEEISSLLEIKKLTLNEIDNLKIEETANKEKVIEINKDLINLKLELDKYKSQLNDIYKSIDKNKSDLQGKIANYNLLINMEEHYEGYFKSVKNLMLAYKKDRTLKNKLIGIVADLIKVDNKFEKAIEVALGGSIQYVVTKDENDAKFIINYLKERKLGRITFLPLSNIKGNPINIDPRDKENYNILGLASELVKYDNKYKDIIEFLLGRTIVVTDMDSAIKTGRRYNYYYRVVTLEGDIINSGGSITGGSFPKTNNLLNRKHRIEQLKEEINNLSKMQNKLEENRVKLNEKINELLDNIKNKEKQLQDMNIQVIKVENELSKKQSDLNRYENEIQKYKDEVDKLNAELKLIKEDEIRLIKEIELISNNKEIIENEVEKSLEVFKQKKKVLEEAKKEFTDIKIQMNKIESNIKNREEKIDAIEIQIKNIENTMSEKESERKTNLDNIDKITKNLLNLKEEFNKLSSNLKEKDKKLSSLKEDKNTLMKDFYLIQNRLKEMLDEINKLENLKNSYTVKETKFKTQLDNIYQKLEEEYNLNLSEAVKYRIEIEDIKQAEIMVKNLKDRIRKLGTVDLDSIDEFKQVKERLEFLKNQHNDLLTAKKDLNKVIKDMEKNMKRLFVLNLKIINKYFNEIFNKLFDGGKASIELEDEENILNSGIQIKVQPPGKKLQNLNLLSGGEKSLTAVAILFSILKAKPTPFCILDEIDAALDEANINKYTSCLIDLTKDTQFIIITHRKKTMEIADVLYGVTMEEKGISKVVSVKLTDNLRNIAS